MTDSVVPSPTHLALRADLLDFTAAPEWGDVSASAVRYRPDHWLLIEQGRIVGAQPGDEAPDARYHRVDHRGRLLMPGFIDTHVHSPQLDVIASYGTELLDWLNTYTFPAERRYADPQVAQAGAERFTQALLAHGTTSAMVFPTVHKVSADAMFRAAQRRGMRMWTGKVLMDRHAPHGLRDDVAQAERDCTDLIDQWHGVDRLTYTVTVRFAPTSTPEQLSMAGALCRARPGVCMQTHLAENRAEVEWVKTLFPQARSYLDVYQRAGLVYDRSVFAHAIWLDETDRAVLRDADALLAHSPSSNLFLGSGLYDWVASEARGLRTAIATDVGGGTSLSMLRTVLDAYRIQAMAGQRLTAWCALHAATRAPAIALGVGDEIGTLSRGAVADLCIWDWACGAVAEHRDALVNSLHERVFAWLTLGDERNLVSAYVAGKEQHARS